MKILKGLFAFLFFISLASPVSALENESVDVVVEVVYLDKNVSIDDLVLDDGTLLSEHTYQIVYPRLRINTDLGIYFYSVAWITRDGKVSLSMNPKYDVRINYYSKETAWNILKNSSVGFGYDPRFYNNQLSLKNQYDCHFSYGFFEVSWDLEPYRPVVDWQTMILKRCNP